MIILINKFILKHKTNLDKIKRIYINRGPGSYAGLRNSVSIVKAIHLTKKIDLYQKHKPLLIHFFYCRIPSIKKIECYEGQMFKYFKPP